MFEVCVEDTFAAGHALRNYHGKCENVHGHNYRVRATFRGEKLDDIGLLVDFVEVKRIMGAVIDKLDHQWLNDMPPFDQLNPSAENMAKFIFDEISTGMKTQNEVVLAEIKLWETDTSSAIYRR